MCAADLINQIKSNQSISTPIRISFQKYQINKNDDELHTVLRDQWIIRGAEIDEPVPVRTFSQQNRGGV